MSLLMMYHVHGFMDAWKHNTMIPVDQTIEETVNKDTQTGSGKFFQMYPERT